MCWITYSSRNIQGLIAKTDIPILKVLGRNGVTPFQCYFIPFNEKLPRVSIHTPLGSNAWYIHQGYHSYSTDSKVLNGIYTFYLKLKDGSLTTDFMHTFNVYNGYIPKGTTYYENEYGEIVSETMVVTNESAKTVTHLHTFRHIDILVDNGDGKLKRENCVLSDIINYGAKAKGVIFRDYSSIRKDYYNCISLMDEDWMVGGHHHALINLLKYMAAKYK